MKHSLFFLLRVIVLPILGAVSFSASAQTTAQGFYYPPSAWDLQLQCNTHATCPRFVVLSNWIDTDHPSGGAAVLDRETGLVWERSPSTLPVNWSVAQGNCNSLKVGKRLGWRLATLQELASLIDPTVPYPGPTLPAGHPFSNVQPGLFSYYWSATTSADFASDAWNVAFNVGDVFSSNKSTTKFVWCVRGGQGVDPQ